jgi:uncharacterized protein (TIGR03067 family)
MAGAGPEAMEGVWEMLRAEQSGEPAPEGVAERTTLRLVAGVYEVAFEGAVVDRGAYVIGPARTITLRGESGPNAGRTIPCLYQLAGDRLRICYGLDGIAPTEFATQPGQPRYLATYRRRPPTTSPLAG